MDVLKPNLVWVEDRCYRHYDFDVKGNVDYNNEDDDIVAYDDCYNVGTLCPDGIYTLNFHIPENMIGFILGKNATTKIHIEYDTKTNIQIDPKEKDNIKISGRTNKSVSNAKNRITNILAKNRKTLQATHFISIPIISKEFDKNYSNFKKDILENYEDRGIEKALFPQIEKMHLTITMLTLLDHTEVDQVANILTNHYQTIFKDLIDPKPLIISLKGIEYMNDDPSQVDVLYAKVDPFQELDRLQALVDSVVDRLVADGVCQRQYERVKIHVTIMNSKYRDRAASDVNNGKRLSTGNRETFDARNILKHYAQFNFGQVPISAMHLSRRFTTAKDGYYTSECVVKL